MKAQISRALVDLHIQDWFSKIELSSKGKKKYLLKQELSFENYLINLSKKHYSSLLKFRLSNRRLPVETGCWENIPLDERKYNLCPAPSPPPKKKQKKKQKKKNKKKQKNKQTNDIGDEFLYLFVCDYFQSDRKQFLKFYFYKKPNVMKFKELFSTKDTQPLINLAKFVIMKKFPAMN